MNFSDTLFGRENEPTIPSYPFYGYDNTEELDKDVDYMKSLCSRTLKTIQKEVDEECDKLEYEGSCMFDTFPDQVHLGTIIDIIYDRLADRNWEDISNDSNSSMGQYPSMQMEQIGGPGFRQPPPPPQPCRGPFCPPPPRPSRPPRPPRPDNRPDGRPDWLRDLISSLLYNEMIHRRRRYRSRRRWNNR